MISGSTQTFGLVVADVENPFFARVSRGVADTARKAGFEVILANSDEDVEKERTAVRLLVSKRVDGIIVAPASQTKGRVDHLAEAAARVPVVFLDRRAAGIDADAVVIDNRGAARAAVAYLTGLDHQRIAVVNEWDELTRACQWRTPGELVKCLEDAGEFLPTSASRLLGYMDAIVQAGLTIDLDLIFLSSYSRQSAAQSTIRALTLAAPATAVFATDNLMTLGAFGAIGQMGLACPRDASLVGFDDLEWTEITTPPLTVIRQPVYEMGAKAAELLVDRVAGTDVAPRTLSLDTSLVVRASATRSVGGGQRDEGRRSNWPSTTAPRS
jgi:LacI family transcriptional regulator